MGALFNRDEHVEINMEYEWTLDHRGSQALERVAWHVRGTCLCTLFACVFAMYELLKVSCFLVRDPLFSAFLAGFQTSKATRWWYVLKCSSIYFAQGAHAHSKPARTIQSKSWLSWFWPTTLNVMCWLHACCRQPQQDWKHISSPES